MDFLKKVLGGPLEKQRHEARIKKEMKKGKISLYDEDIIQLLEDQPMFYFQTAADFMLLKDILGQPAQHIATNVMALALDGYVKRMHLVEADLDPTYPDLLEDGTEIKSRGRTYLEVVFFEDGESEKSDDGVVETEEFIKEMKTEQWYVIDANLGLIFEKGLYLRLEQPQIISSLSGNLLREVIDETRRMIEPDLNRNSDHIIAVMRGLEHLFREYPKYKYRELLFRRLVGLQEIILNEKTEVYYFQDYKVARKIFGHRLT